MHNRIIAAALGLALVCSVPAVAGAQETWTGTSVWASAGTTVNGNHEQLAEAWIIGVYPISKHLRVRGSYAATRGIDPEGGWDGLDLPTVDSFSVALGYSGPRFALGGGVAIVAQRTQAAEAHGLRADPEEQLLVPLPTLHARLGPAENLYLSAEILGASPIFDVAAVGLGYGFNGRGRLWVGGAFGALPGIRISGEIPVQPGLRLAPYARIAADAEGNPNILAGIGFTWRPGK